ncbi:hypothetical protein GOC38_14705 [Sinorhizobium meliloti]|nr:hypothetical protein [Sinorhizobium meliloti]MDX0325511.1 hypothetical protein [Sinorhizobium meliloti]
MELEEILIERSRPSMKKIAIATVLCGAVVTSANANSYPGVDPRIVKAYAQCMLAWDKDFAESAKDSPGPDYDPAATEQFRDQAAVYADGRFVLCMEAKGAVREDFCSQNETARNRNCYRILE